MTTTSLIVFGMVLVTASCIAIANASIYVGGTSGSSLQVDMNTKYRQRCPNIRLGANSGLNLSVRVNGQNCQSYGGEFGASGDSEMKTGNRCPGINVVNSSGLHVTITFSRGAQKFRGLDVRNKAGEHLNYTFDLGDCRVPDINMSGLSGTYVYVRGG